MAVAARNPNDEPGRIAPRREQEAPLDRTAIPKNELRAPQSHLWVEGQRPDLGGGDRWVSVVESGPPPRARMRIEAVSIAIDRIARRRRSSRSAFRRSGRSGKESRRAGHSAPPLDRHDRPRVRLSIAQDTPRDRCHLWSVISSVAGSDSRSSGPTFLGSCPSASTSIRNGAGNAKIRISPFGSSRKRSSPMGFMNPSSTRSLAREMGPRPSS